MFEEIRKELIKNSDENITKLTEKLCPNIEDYEILGIKIPILRKRAKQIASSDNFEKYLEEINNSKLKKYLEEIILEGLIIAYSKIDLEKKLEMMKNYVPKINNWLINDTVCATIKTKDNKELKLLWNFITPYLKSKNQFEVRFAVVMMLDNFIIEEYVDKVIEKLDKVENTEYYAEMAISWTLAEIGIKFNEKAMKYLKGNNNLDKFTFNKTLQKMRESYRISKEQKEELKKMKR